MHFVKKTFFIYFFILIFSSSANASFTSLKTKIASSSEEIWKNGDSLLTWLDREGINSQIYYNLNSTDKELATEIYAGSRYFVLRENNLKNIGKSGTTKGKILQVLIPISEDVELRIKLVNDNYVIDFVPIFYETYTSYLNLKIDQNLYTSIIDATSSPALAREFLNAYKGSVNFKREVQKGDKLAIIFDYKKRLGRYLGTPELLASAITTNKTINYLFNYDNRYYDLSGNEIAGFLLENPLKTYRRISSRFSLGRYHPVLKRVRPHFGVDYAANYGTTINAASSGKVVFAGRNGGYGLMVKINHNDGLVTLYAHMSKINVKRGQNVKKGQRIGAVGSTGVSTGPHLHFGVYKNNRPINPLGTIRTVKQKLSNLQRKKYKEQIAKIKVRLDELLLNTSDSATTKKSEKKNKNNIINIANNLMAKN